MSSSFQPDALLYGSGNNSAVNSSTAESTDVSVNKTIEGSHEDSPNILRNEGHGKLTVTPVMGSTQPRVAGPLTRLGVSSSHLPDLEPHQHSTLFYLSLIEGRCRSQAAYLLNEGLHPTDKLREDHPEVRALARPLFAEMSKELHKAGILPDDFAGEDLEELRGKYLNTFDTALHNIATKATHIIPDQSTTPSSKPLSNAFAIARASRASAMENIIKPGNSPSSQQSPLSSLILRGSGGEQLPTSIFQTQYGPKTLMGKGGFGHVFAATNLVDDRRYAIKRIVIRGKKVNLASNKDQQQALLMEARSLSKLNHQNIVRYYGAWVETCPAGTRIDADSSSDENSDSSTSEDSGEQSSKFEKPGFDNGAALGRQRDPGGPVVYTQDESDVFERGEPATTSAEPSKTLDQIDETTEELSALANSPKSLRSKGPNSESQDNRIVPRFTKPRQTLMADLDAIVFIKMDLYPMTLEQFLWESHSNGGETELQHCFHIPPTAQILSAILDGVEYIHSQGMVHRDLKPGNILLSVHSDIKPASPSTIDVKSCSECGNGAKVRRYFITPHIGDFGLVAEIRKPVGDSVRTPRGEDVFEPTELARLAPAGSKFYLPEAPVNVICPKLDVYSLGVVAFELIYKFSTKAERVVVLQQLKQGVLPAQFKDHIMASGINAMVCGNRNNRWDCSDARKWLEDIKERYRHV